MSKQVKDEIDNEEDDVTIAPFGFKEGEEPPMAMPDMADDSVSQTKVIREDGKLERKRRAVSLGISELLLPPYTRRGVATYRLKPTYEIDPSTGEPPIPTSDEFPGTYQLFDKFEKDPVKKSKTMFNFGRQLLVDDEKTGKKTLKYSIEPLIFNRGLMQIKIMENYRKYVFTELYPNNGSNKYRPAQAPILFERIDITTHKSAAFRLAEQDLALEAEIAIRKLTRDQIIGYAVTAGLPVTGRQPSDISVDLRVFARQDPKKFFSMHSNALPAIKLDILDADNLGMIEYQEDRKRWIECETGESLYVVSVGDDPVDAFVEKVGKSSELHDRIKKLVDYWDRTPI